MMVSKLLSAGDSEHGFARWVNDRFDGLRRRYTNALTATLRYRPVVLTLWAIVVLLIFPFYMFSQKELAPAEDQSFFFAILQAPANSTIDQVRLFANQLVQKAFTSGKFMYADTDLKFDQPQARVVFNRDKLRSEGVDLAQAGRDLSVLLGGNYVNRFSIQGRSYKVIPLVKRSDRLTPDQLGQMYVTGGNGKLVPLSTFATLETTTDPRELKRFQLVN